MTVFCMRNKKEKNYKQDVLQKAQFIADNFREFCGGVRVLFLIHRNKEGGEHSNTKLIKAVSRSEEDIVDTIYELLIEKDKRSELTLRIYMSVNARNMQKAVRQFKQNMLDNDYNKFEEHDNFYFDIWNRWISSLMKPASRDETFFLIDCDDENETQTALKELAGLEKDDMIIKQYKTKNGMHIITKPYNPNLTPFCNTKMSKDGLLLINF